MVSQKSLIVLARVFAGLTLALGCMWLLGIIILFQLAMSKNSTTAFVNIDGVQIGLMSVLFGAHLVAAWAGARSSIRGSVAMLSANVLSLIAPTYLNVPVVPGPAVKAVLLVVSAALVVFVLLQISVFYQRNSVP